MHGQCANGGWVMSRTWFQLAALFGVAIYGVSAAPGLAQDVRAERTLTLQFENDMFAGADRHYTNGMRLGYIPRQTGKRLPWTAEKIAQLMGWVPRIDPLFANESPVTGDRVLYSYSLTHNMFTPTKIEWETPDPKDRPYAGWLHWSVALHALNAEKSKLDTVEFSAGVVGPSARGGDIQVWWHKVHEFKTPMGWHHQLRDEPALLLLFDRKQRWKNNLKEGRQIQYEMITNYGGAVGNVYDFASIGVLGRIGLNIPKDFGPPRIRPSMSGFDAFQPANKPFSFYVFGGVNARGVLRDIFLDGNSFKNSPRVDKRMGVAEGQAGAVLMLWNFRLAYEGAYRSREFHGQDEPDQFAGVSLSTRMPF